VAWARSQREDFGGVWLLRRGENARQVVRPVGQRQAEWGWPAGRGESGRRWASGGAPHSKGLCKTKSGFRAEFQHGPPAFTARQIRSPKSEIRNKFKTRKLQGSKRREAAWFCDSDFGPSGLFRISDFVFRILGKVTIPLRNDSESPEVIFARTLSLAQRRA